jgi:cell division protein FtsZ
MSPDVLRLGSAESKTCPRIKVVGIGGAGCNIVSDSGLDSVAVLTEKDRLESASTKKCVLTRDHIRLLRTTAPQMFPAIGGDLKGGLFGGIGEADLMFLFAGLGGEMGSHVTPALANICRRQCKLVVVSAALPFSVEGGERRYTANQAFEKIVEHSDLVISYSNDSLLKIAPNLPLRKAFGAMDMIMIAPVIDLARTLTLEDLSNLRQVFSSCKRVRVGIGISGGLDRELRAVEEAFTSPWFDFDLDDAKTALVVTSASFADDAMQERIAKDISYRLPNARLRYAGRVEAELGERIRVLVLLGTGEKRP